MQGRPFDFWRVRGLGNLELDTKNIKYSFGISGTNIDAF
jgi:hypothetical protein